MEQGRREEDMQQQQSLTGIFNNHHHHRSTPPQPHLSSLFPRTRPHFDYPSASPDDSYFLDQMLSTLTSPSPSWPPPDHDIPLDNDPSPASLAAKLRLHQIATDHFIPPGSEGLPDGPHSPFKTLACLDGIGGGSIEALYNGYGDSGSGSLHGIVGSGQASATFINQEGGSMQNTPSFGGGATAMGAGSNDGGTAGSGAAQPRQRVRARRGQATDPHSIAERLRRERIAERMKALQELVPNANKTDKASMLDEIIDYVKFLQLQVKVLSMSRLGGAACVAPLVADLSAEGVGGGAGAIDGGQHIGGNAGDGGLMVTEHQVAKLMEEDMGSAMQYLQGKGLCLMPISLATAISTVTCQSRAPKPPLHFGATVDGPSSPGLSALTVQSATTIMGNANSSAKNNGSITE